ncbi:MAG: FeoA family protein [Sarcina sp.]
MMPMNVAREGENIRVKRIMMDDLDSKRFMEMGLTSSNIIKIVQNTGKSLIIAIAGTKIGLDITAARKIMVECV